MQGPHTGYGGYVYMMGNGQRITIYVGVTANLVARVWQHKYGDGRGFTKDYHCADLMWYENHDCIEDAIRREKTIKRWQRGWKIDAIRKMNPEYRDLAADCFLSSQAQDTCRSEAPGHPERSRGTLGDES